ncbi:hypothetical protein WAZ07_21735 [Bacillus sp. FJAT-51639]|uniref:Uncharacterized protein n=1 Tax=Bacillus bruguierae TaxID=3127667 RepID=A0ABU8FQ36_9BACI
MYDIRSTQGEVKFYTHFKNLWKLVFKKNEEREQNNRKVNYDVLLIIYKRYENILIEYMEKESAFFSSFLEEYDIQSKLIDFLSQYTEVYNLLKPHAQEELQNRVKGQKSWEVRAIFLSNSLKEHFKYVDSSIHSSSYKLYNQPYIQMYLLKEQDIALFKEQAEKEGVVSEFYDLMISHYYHSGGFDAANSTFNRCIEPFYKEFNKDQFEVLLKEINSNPQCYNGRHSSRNKILLEKAKEVMPGIDLQSEYANIFG